MKKILPLLFLIALFFPAASARAHPADMYGNNIQITLTQSGMKARWEIKPGPMLVSFLWHEADANQDEILSAEEESAWGESRASFLTATLDKRELPLRLDSAYIPKDLTAFQAGEDFIVLQFSTTWQSELTGTHTLVIKNMMETKKSINFYQVKAEDPAAFLFPIQRNHVLEVDFAANRSLMPDSPSLLTVWDSGTPSLPVGQQKDTVTETAEQVVPQLAERTPQEILLDLVREKEFSLAFYIFALFVSLALGALHALTPGHGKTVVAAYLVGSRGTTWHAIVLGSVVTLTHTGSVFLLGVITLAASQYILPTAIIPALEILSGLLIVGLGLYLFWQRFLYWRNLNQKQQKERKIGLGKFSAKKPAGAIKIEKPNPNLHHHGDGKLHSHEVPEQITWKSLIALGVSGGLVPCPDAIAILLVAVAINRLMLGLALIVSFSLGLAVVLIIIGLAMVHSARLFRRMDSFNKIAPFMPVISAAVVLLLGIALTYGAIARMGSGESLPLPESSSRVEEARVLYLLEDEEENRQLFLFETRSQSSIRLTNAPKGVVDYAPAPDGRKIVYIEMDENLEYNLRLVNVDGANNRVIVPCKSAVCSQPVWSADGGRIVYEYMPQSEEGASLPALWWFDLETNKSQPVFQESRLPGSNARWSPDGAWMSYSSPDGIKLIHFESGETRVIKNALGAAAEWSPDGKFILLRDVVIENERFITQLFLYEIKSQKMAQIGADAQFENILAAWSPDGNWIAVVRRDSSTPRGDQVWLMRPNGSEARALTDTPNVLHGSLNWSPDGKYLLYDLYLLDSAPLKAQLEMIEVESGNVKTLTDGYTPKWIWTR